MPTTPHPRRNRAWRRARDPRVVAARWTHACDRHEAHDRARATRRAGSLPILPARAAAW